MSDIKQTKRMLACIVQNALDFLKQSISELEQKPKYSVIHFHAAIELFLKARLMAEHWSLVVSPKKEADWQEFTSGKFSSVTFEEAAKRLSKVVQSGLSSEQIKLFSAVTKHRNRMIHFYHEAETSEAGKHRIRAIVKEQLVAWYLLHDLLLRQWNSIFSEWGKEIAAIDTMLREHHEFLKVIFDMLKTQIDDEKNKGYEFLECPSCGFESNRHSTEENQLYESECLVCGLSANCIRIHCIECNNGIALFQGEACAECESCTEKYDGEMLREIFENEGEAYRAAKDGDGYPFPLNCGECSGHKTVVQVAEEEYLCTECFAISNEYGTCGWCNEESTGLSEDTYLNGCEFCDGRLGWEKD